MFQTVVLCELILNTDGQEMCSTWATGVTIIHWSLPVDTIISVDTGSVDVRSRTVISISGTLYHACVLVQCCSVLLLIVEWNIVQCLISASTWLKYSTHTDYSPGSRILKMLRPVTMLVIIMMLTMVSGEKINIVDDSGDMLVKTGDTVNMTCDTDQDWFFCLWKHPGGVKECSIQENGGYRSVCAGHTRGHAHIVGAQRSCSLILEQVLIVIISL